MKEGSEQMGEYQKVVVIGLDCADPELMFKQFRGELPTINHAMEVGTYGKLHSTVPPITVPAWMSMMTSKTPGELGVYGFRNRKDTSYGNLQVVSGDKIRDKKVWDLLGMEGISSTIVGVPLTYPAQPLNGHLVSCFMTPGVDSKFTYPSSLKKEILEKFGDYSFDVEDFRTENREDLLNRIEQYTEQKFDVAEYLLKEKPWDFFVMVEMGTDRIQHAFWHYMDESHVLYEENDRYRNVIRNHYQRIDKRIEKLLNCIPDGTLVFIVSDHGAQKMDGGFCINQWLIAEGYLTLRTPVHGITPFRDLDIDWSKTRAYADGGYYGRLFLNIKDREPEGTVEPEDVAELLNEIEKKLEALTTPDGKMMNNKLLRPQEVYPICRNIAPDGILYFGDLYWRSIGSVGHNSCFIKHNDSGPDGANHSQQGIFMGFEKQTKGLVTPRGFVKGEHSGLSIYDVAPTILEAFGVTVPVGFRGSCLQSLACQQEEM